MALNYITAQEAAALVKNDDNVGFGGFTHAGCPKVVPVEIAKRAEEEHAKGNPFKIGVFTGASTGDSIDGALSRAKAIKFRTPYQFNKDLRKAINNGEVEYFDMHLSQLAQEIRYGFLGGIDVAVVEACDVSENGEIVPTTAVGIAPTICRLAKVVIAKNITAEPGERIIYVRIMTPDGNVLTKNPSDTFPFENGNLQYSIKRIIEYGGEEMPVTVYWNIEEYLMPGTYKVDIFADGNHIGSHSFTMQE